jgi:hypothetical protein
VITEDWFFASHFLDRAIAAKNSGYKVSVVTRCRETAQQLNAHGLTFEDINFSRRGLNPISELATIVRLRATLRRIKPDIVHNIALKPVVLGSIRRSAQRRKRPSRYGVCVYFERKQGTRSASTC